jgi:hypothetical protein
MKGNIILGLGLGLMLLALILIYPRHKAEPILVQTTEPSRGSVTETHQLAPPLLDRQTLSHSQPAVPPKPGHSTNLLAQLLKDDSVFRLSPQQVEPFLQQNRRSAESLLAAARATVDLSFLREALEKYPNDPRVNYGAVFKSDSLMERRQRLDAFKQAAPDNAMAWYLSAQDYFKSGQTELALQELAGVAAAGNFTDYSRELTQSAEEAYRSAGYSEAESKAISVADLPLPYLAELKRLGQSIGGLANGFRQNGDEPSAQALIQSGVNLAQQVGQNGGQTFFINTLVGIAIERKILERLEPSSPYDTAGRSVQNRLDDLIQTRETLKQFGKQTEDLLLTLSPLEVSSFYDRVKVVGEAEALRWAVNRKNQP